MRRHRVLTFVSCVFLGHVCLFIPTIALAQQPGLAEMRIAEQHAAAASRASNLQQIRAELQQALHCLVGPQGQEYRSRVGDPCKGASAFRKLPNDSVNRIRVQKAIRLASVGVTFHDFKPAHFTAQAVRAVLEEGTQ
jgi:hypothetical protein